jgi:hypothetical protein
MTDQGGGRRQPPPDDRTLLDPLNADELRALREARQKMQAAKSGGGGGHQVVIGPDAGEDIGDAPTRAMPALPQFENAGASLDKIGTGPNPAVNRQTVPSGPNPTGGRGAMPSQAMSQAPTQPAGQPQPPPAGGPTAGPTGFGENTLLWMAPPKPPPAAAASTVGGMTGEMRAVKRSPKSLAKPVAAIAVLVMILGGLAWAVLGKKERAVIDLHTNPPKAQVKINGTATKNMTPMKLNLQEGTYEVEINLEGYKPHIFTVNIEPGAAPSRRDIDLEPISQAGMMTVAIAVQPVAANITVDGQLYPAKRSVNIANIDPNQAHKITIEAGGYVKIEQDVPAGQLKKNYNFILQQDETKKPGQE